MSKRTPRPNEIMRALEKEYARQRMAAYPKAKKVVNRYVKAGGLNRVRKAVANRKTVKAEAVAKKVVGRFVKGGGLNRVKGRVQEKKLATMTATEVRKMKVANKRNIARSLGFKNVDAAKASNLTNQILKVRTKAVAAKKAIANARWNATQAEMGREREERARARARAAARAMGTRTKVWNKFKAVEGSLFRLNKNEIEALSYANKIEGARRLGLYKRPEEKSENQLTQRLIKKRGTLVSERERISPFGPSKYGGMFGGGGGGLMKYHRFSSTLY